MYACKCDHSHKKCHKSQLDAVCLQEMQRVDKVHPLEAKRSCDAISTALKRVEDNINNMFSDVQALKDGRYHQADQMYRR